MSIKKINLPKVVKRNILHVILSLDIGGAESLVVEFAKESNPEIFNVKVCCLDKVGDLGEELISEGYSVIALGRRPGIDWRLIFRLRKLLQEEKIDIIHAHQYTPFFYASLARFYSRKSRLIFTEHGRFYPEKKRIKRIIFDPLLSRFASGIVAISEATKDAMVQYDNFPGKKIKIIYNGVKLKVNNVRRERKRHELDLSLKDFVLATASRLDSIKNHKMLIRVMKKIVKIAPCCKLLIAGSGSEYDKLFAEIKEYDLSEYVYLLGYRSDVMEIFFASDVFLLSSLTEGTSITLLEAMYAGLPAIVTNVGGNSEILEEKVTGFMVDSNDDQGMADKILFLYRNKNVVKQMGEAGKKRVRTLFSFEKMMKQYEELYKKCVG